TSAARVNTTWHLAHVAPLRPATSSLRRASRQTASAPSPTVRSVQSLFVMTFPAGHRIAAQSRCWVAQEADWRPEQKDGRLDGPPIFYGQKQNLAELARPDKNKMAALWPSPIFLRL